MYLIGFNTIHFPWFIPKDFPRDALKKADREKLVRFIDDYNQDIQYKFWEKIVFVLSKLIYPPLAKAIHYRLRRNRFSKLQHGLFRSFTPQFWSDKGDNKTLRLGVSKDY